MTPSLFKLFFSIFIFKEAIYIDPVYFGLAYTPKKTSKKYI